MGNTNQKTSGQLKNKNNSDDNVMVNKLEQQLRLFKDNPVFTMLSEFIKKVGQQVPLFKTNHVLPVLSKFGDWQTVHPPPQKLPEDKKTNSLALWQVSAVGGYFVVKWAWAKWNEQRTKKKSSDDPF